MTTWHMAHRICKTSNRETQKTAGPVGFDETYIGDKEANKHKNRKPNAGRGTIGKTAVAGAKDRNTSNASASVVANTDRAALQGFVGVRASLNPTVYTDEHAGYVVNQRVHKRVEEAFGLAEDCWGAGGSCATAAWPAIASGRKWRRRRTTSCAWLGSWPGHHLRGWSLLVEDEMPQPELVAGPIRGAPAHVLTLNRRPTESQCRHRPAPYTPTRILHQPARICRAPR